jgi:uncharacterized membrane protein
MSDGWIRKPAIALSLAGVALTGYLLYERSDGRTLLCSTGGCETVQSSEYATVLGFPVALLGLVGFLVFLGLFVARGALAEASAVAVGIAAVLFSSYLLVIQLMVLDAICDWCLASDVLVTALAALALLRALSAARLQARHGVDDGTRDHQVLASGDNRDPNG